MSYIRPPNAMLAGAGLKQSPPGPTVIPTGLLPVLFDAEIGSAIQLGMVKIGNNIDVDIDGVISVTFPDSNCGCEAINVSENYTATTDDFYIGVTATGPVTITLPVPSKDCIKYVIKADMPPPLGTKKVTLLPLAPSKIDDATSAVITVAYDSISVISQGGDWHTI